MNLGVHDVITQQLSVRKQDSKGKKLIEASLWKQHNANTTLLINKNEVRVHIYVYAFIYVDDVNSCVCTRNIIAVIIIVMMVMNKRLE